MISVLICSGNPGLFTQAKNNIEETIGVEHEVLCIDNREFNNGICGVYNRLAMEAKFALLCFVHEDILFQTINWGKKILEIFFNDAEVGLVGIAGCKYKSQYFSGWFSNTKELDCANYVHQYKDGTEEVYLSPSNDNNLQEVVCIDGVFMCCKKDVWEKNRFDEDFLKGFHFYDIDFSLRIAHSYKVLVTYDVLLTHITTGGDYGNKWIEIAMDYHEHIKDHLPYSKIIVNKKIADRNTVLTMLDFLKNYNISVSNKVKWIVLQKLFLHPKFYYAILKFALYKPLKLKAIHQSLKR